jgi:23S rRNA (adenine2503-C2)-methyltransferase
LLNYDNVIKSIKILSKKYPFSRATISTVGIEPKMRALAKEKLLITLKLHLSLHAPYNKLRNKIIPHCSKINTVLQALKYFSESKKVISKANYLLIKNFNDSKEHAFQLAKLLKPYPFVVKLSKLNPCNGLKPSEDATFEMFEEILHAHNIATCRFISLGTDISAGCGQFRRYYYNNL